ncbi:MAG: YdcF family protein [Alphaproteobacteria bacterium]|nr:YdcF family protein [Alphaproteobacteria bacterium]
MWFVLSKLYWQFFSPVNLLVGLFVVAVAWLLWRRSTPARRFTLVMLVAVIVLGVLPIPWLMLRPLEQRFAKPVPPPASVAGIIILGGAVRPNMTALRGEVSLNRAAERMTEAVALTRRYPAARLVFTGANASLIPNEHTEAAVARRFFAEMGLDADAVTYEDRSRNTYENALFTRDLVKPRAGETWLMVTSARHMPRAVGCFRKVGFAVVPWPVDYETPPPGAPYEFGFDVQDNLQDLNDALHEWIGMLAYWMIGYSSEPFPGP